MNTLKPLPIFCMLLSILAFETSAQLSDAEMEKRKKEKLNASHVTHASNASKRGGLPEQDCNSAIAVCKTTYVQPDSYIGHGPSQEIPATSCLGSREVNSVWYIFTVKAPGTLEFIIAPNNSNDDYDFALYDLTGRNCSDISSGVAPEVRCNFCVNPGEIGLSPSGVNASEDCCTNYPNCWFSSVLNVAARQTYALIVSNYSSTQSGYILTFGGSANIFDDVPPSPVSVEAPCGTANLTLQMSEAVLCDAISPDGSEFTITGPGGPFTVTEALGINCGNATSQISINYSPPVKNGNNYILTIKPGSDGDGLFDNCGNELSDGSIDFSTAPPPPVTITGPITICRGSEMDITASPGDRYLWSTGETTQSISVKPAIDATYSVTVATGSCSGSATHDLRVDDSPIADFTVNPQMATVDDPVQFTDISKLLRSCSGMGIDPCTTNADCQNDCQLNPSKHFWNFGDGSTAEGQGNQEHIYNTPGTYNVSLLIIDEFAECSNKVTIPLTVQGEERKLFIPNAISPNGDGVNDVFNVLGGSEIKKLDLKIYSRSGKKIFETTDQSDGWNGTFKGKAMELGVYVYAVEAEFVDGYKISKKGNVTLVK